MNEDLQLASYDFELPEDAIAQEPAQQRDQSRLMVLDSRTDTPTHTRFASILNYLRPGDLVIRNDTRVFPARLLGRKETGGRVEMLLLEYPNTDQERPGERWQTARVQALIKSSKRPKAGSTLHFHDDIRATVTRLRKDGKVDVELRYRPGDNKCLDDLLHRCGQIPLPPYIHRPDGSTPQDALRYQTCYARTTGSVAAPTAGLHFSRNLLAAMGRKGIETCSVTLHVGYGTFAPVRCQDITEHPLHKEFVEISRQTAELINRAKKEKRRIWAVGTTTVRTLEFAADSKGKVQPTKAPCALYIYPGFKFQVIDNLITNFHLPRSSLLFLVAALTGRKRLLASYREAIARGYRFFSYGDAMAIIQKQ